MPDDSDNSDDVPCIKHLGASTIAMMILFGASTFATVGMVARPWLLEDNRALRAALNLTSQAPYQTYRSVRPLDMSYVSIYSFLHHMTLFGLILFTVYLLEHHPPFPHEEKTVFDADYLVFLLILFLGIASRTVQRNDGKEESSRAAPSTRTVTFHADATVATVTSRRSVGTGASVGSAGSAGSVEVISLQGTEAGARKSDSSSIKSDEHKSMLAALYDAQSVDRTADSQSIASKTSYSTHRSVNKRLDEILLDEETVKTEGTLPEEDTIFVPANKLAPLEPINDVLNYPQSLEWKGWMQTAFLAYQMTNGGSYTPVAAEENDTLDEDVGGMEAGVNHYYNIARLFVSSYVFMTGFNHTLYFYAKGDFSIVRVLHIMFRINLTVVFLCLTLGNRYILYSVCPLHSYCFLLVYVTMRLHRRLNYTKFGLRIKILGLGLAIFFVWDCNLGLFELIHSPFFASGPVGLPGAPHGPLWEWYYRTHLHHWSALMAMVFAVNHPIMSLLMRKLEVLGDSVQTISKGIVGVALLGAVSIWATGPLHATKVSFNLTHPYFVFIPILCFLYLRNMTQTLREHSLGLFKSFGKYSLELYLLHHHLFLSSNGSTILVLLPGYPKLNMILVTLLLLYMAKMLKSVTGILTGMMIPSNDEGKSVMNVVLLGGALLASYTVAVVLRSMNVVSLSTIAIITIIFGMLIYQTVMDMTWGAHRRGQAARSRVNESETTTIKASPAVIGTLVVFLLGLALHAAALSGATTSSAPLDMMCDTMVNDGLWVPINACSPFYRGIATREYGVGGFYDSATNCNQVKFTQWAWRATPPSAQCQFRHRSSEELRRKMTRRRLVFVGDTMMRNLFYSICRALGEDSCGDYDATIPVHSDDEKTVGDTILEYKWAPLAVDEASKLKEYRAETSTKATPDLIVVGGGAWDRLHVYATDEDQESHKTAVKKLTSELTSLRAETISTVWFTPTTVNTQALSSEEKRIQMSEDGMQEMRRIYAKLGVEEAAAFVLDGTSFTRGRAAESYDGIHYPPDVFDAGAQILANAFDWLIPDVTEASSLDAHSPPPVGTMSNPFLGAMVLCFAMIGLFFFDGYLGFSFLASVVVRGDTQVTFSVMPNDLYEEAFGPLHQRFKLPALVKPKGRDAGESQEMVATDEEILSLAGSKVGGSTTMTRRSSAGTDLATE